MVMQNRNPENETFLAAFLNGNKRDALAQYHIILNFAIIGHIRFIMGY